METEPRDNSGHEPFDRPAYTGGRWKLVKALLSVIIVAVGVAGMNYLITTAPKAKRRPPAKMAPLVQVRALYPASQAVSVQAMGTVVPAREMTLEARVSGEITSVHPDFIEGGLLQKGRLILEIDDADYRFALARAENAVVDARYALALEMGRQDVARREWHLLNGPGGGGGEDGALALRKPHLEKARADLAAAESDLAQARLQLERTRIHAPFNAVIRARHVSVGSQVTAQKSLAVLVGTDRYRVRVSVPEDRLDWIAIPRHHGDAGAPVRVQVRNGREIEGRVVKLLGDLDTEGRMARLLVSVDDPLGLETGVADRPPLLIGAFVRVRIEGRRMASAFRIPRAALRDDNRVWIAAKNDTLEIRTVRTVWRDKTDVLVNDGLAPGDRLIVSNLAAPVPGMPLTIQGGPGPERRGVLKPTPKRKQG
jgi:RND family efflux transporter MFP subunit